MRTAMILAAVAACAVATACSKKSSLYLEPGRPVDAAQAVRPPAPPAASPPGEAPGMQKASQVESAQR